MSTPAIAVIGAGVRGTAALGRLAARIRPGGAPRGLVVHVIDPYPPGPGKIWRTEQPRSLVMNTVPAQSTVFDDATLAFDAPFHGPTFAEWCRGVAHGRIAPPGHETDWVRELAAATTPWSAPSRALYGAYLRWAYERFVAALPDGVTVTEHRARATGIARVGDRYRIDIAHGADAPDAAGAILVDAALLALGWLHRDHGAAHDIGPENPIDQPVDRIAPGEKVAVRGVGMSFTDLLTLVTEERGGRYDPAPLPGRPGALRYERGGREPTLLAGSRAGSPFLAKPDFGDVPPPARLAFLTKATPGLVARRPVDFGRDVLPLIERDAAAAYHDALRRIRPDAYRAVPDALFAALDADAWDPAHRPAAALPDWHPLERAALADPDLQFAPERVAAPFLGVTADARDAEIRERIAADAAEAARGSASPWKLGLHAYQAARAAIIPLTDFGGITPASRPALREYLRIAGLIGSGPPLFRVEQLLAAHAAGVVRFAGAGFRVSDDPDGRIATAGDGTLAEPIDRVVDARLDLPDVTRLREPLVASLLDARLARLHTADASGTPTLEITADASALVGADGTPIRGLHSIGPLHEELRRYTIIAPIPHARSTVLREVDSAIAGILSVATAASPASVARADPADATRQAPTTGPDPEPALET